MEIDRFENKPKYVSDLKDVDTSKTALHIRADVKNKNLITDFQIERLYLIGAKEKDIDFIFSHQQPKYVSLYQFLAKDLSCLEQLTNCETLITEWNTKAIELWDFRLNSKLRKLAIRDYGKINNIEKIGLAKQIISLSLDGGIDKKMKINTLNPIKNLTQLQFLRLTNIKVNDQSLEPIRELKHLQNLELSNQFPTAEYARLASSMPNTDCKMFNAINSVNIKDANGQTVYDVMVTGKRRPFLLRGKDDARIEKYINDFEKLKKNYA